MATGIYTWAYVEAANFIRRYCPEAKSWYQRKAAKDERGGGDEGAIEQVVEGLLFHYAGPGGLRCEKDIWIISGCGNEPAVGLAKPYRADWELPHPLVWTRH